MSDQSTRTQTHTHALKHTEGHAVKTQKRKRHSCTVLQHGRHHFAYQDYTPLAARKSTSKMIIFLFQSLTLERQCGFSHRSHQERSLIYSVSADFLLGETCNRWCGEESGAATQSSPLWTDTHWIRRWAFYRWTLTVEFQTKPIVIFTSFGW